MTLEKKTSFYSPKVILLAAFKFLFSIIFTMMKIQKDNNIVTDIGAEKIAHAKIIVFFLTLMIAILYTSLTNYIKQEKLFYGIFIFLLSLFLLLALLYNFKNQLLPNISNLKESWEGYPSIQSWICVYGNWLQVLFFSVGEILGQLVLIILFWGIANDLFSQSEAKQFYHIFIAAGCVGSICGAFLLPRICRYVESGYMDIAENTGDILGKISSLVSLIGAFIMILCLLGYKWLLSNNDLKKKLSSKKVNNKERLSFLSSCKYIFSNKHLCAITLLVISCAGARSLVDITYKKCIERQTHNIPHEFADWMQWEFFYFNIVVIISCFSVIGHLMRKLSWKKTAYISPISVLLLGVAFFGLSIYTHQDGLENATYLGFSPNKFIASFGWLQTVIVTSIIYIFFDITKEMAFISLDQKARRKGKGAVDVVASRFGKGFASFTHAILFTIFSTKNVFDVTHVLLIIFVMCCLCWIFSINYLSKKVDSKNDDISSLIS